ncbi:hypothetical protein EDC04DRAFT_2600766 [Pisolithus marmoratus]|nr:hypothetical protein EDC04DRAFT_2600766 [Pisolithus marmoratus]
MRGKWFQSRGTVWMVHFNNTYLDFVCDTYGQKISIPITFCCKVAELSGLQLSQWISWDVWVIHGQDSLSANITPPPLTPLPSAIPEDPSETVSEAWTTTVDDLSSTDFGEIPWLFLANCCNFQCYQLGFTMNNHYRPYNNASLRAQESSIMLFPQVS